MIILFYFETASTNSKRIADSKEKMNYGAVYKFIIEYLYRGMYII